MEKIVYLDHAATTPVKEEVLKEMMPYYSLLYGNASSMYSIGRKSKSAIEKSREKVARIIGAKPNEIYFTSGGTESDNLALKGIAKKYIGKGKHIITSKIEHPAILNSCKELEKEGFEISYLSVDNTGLLSVQEVEKNIRKDTILISIMFANNEIGTIQPIKEIGELAHKHGIIFHTDAVQAVGNVKINVNEMQIDILSMSGHKFYGPKGIGAIYIKEGIEIAKIIHGGHQERDIRAGTENVPGIVGIGKAAEISFINLEKNIKKLIELREYCINKIEEKFPKVKLNGQRTKRLPGNCNFSFPGIDSDEILFKLDQKGICVSAGSACSSGSGLPSHVLLAIGLESDFSGGTIRITFGTENTKDDVNYFVDCLDEIINK